MEVSRYRIAIILVLLTGIAVRLYGFDPPVFEHHSLRQLDTAAIARNFAEEKSGLLYPQVDWRGDSPGYVEAEFQLYTYAVSLLYRLFGPDERFGRGINIVIYLLGSLLLYQFTQRLFAAPLISFLTVVFYAVLPLGVFQTRTFQPDALMCLASLAGLYYFLLWTEDDKWVHWGLSALGLSIALAIKPLNLYLAAPLFYLAHQRFGWRLFLVPSLWVYGTLVLVPPALWYFHSYSLWTTYGNTFFRGYAELDISWLYTGLWPGPLFSVHGPSYIFDLVMRLIFLFTTPAGLLLLLLGIRDVATARPRYLLYWWVGGFALPLLLFADQERGHDYYQLPMVFVVSIIMALGAARLWRAEKVPVPEAVLVFLTIAATLLLFLSTSIENTIYGFYGRSLARDGFLVLTCFVVGVALIWNRVPPRLLLTSLVVLTVMSGIWQAWRLLTLEPRNLAHVPFAARIRQLTEPDAPIIIGTMWERPGWVQHRTAHGEYLFHDPIDFYLSHRKGWSINGDKLSPAFVEELRRRGAAYFAMHCCDYTNTDALNLDTPLQRYLMCAHTALDVDRRWVIYRLDGAAKSADPNCRRKAAKPG